MPIPDTVANNQQGGDADKSYFSPPPAVSLPKGGGAIKGMGEKFAANPVTGTASLSVPIFTTPSRADFYPKLSLSYDSGAGNGSFGFGWMLSVPSVTRKTEKGLPQYRDAEESDVFILSEAEDLVPSLINKGGDRWEKEIIPGVRLEGKTYIVERYRPRVEGLFARIERWQNNVSAADTFWKSISKDNVTSLYGKSEDSKIVDPQDKDKYRIFKWLLCESYDDKGNRIVYEYKPENLDNVDRSLPQEKNRLVLGAVSANRYLKYIKYGNKTPGQDDWLFQVVFDYTEQPQDSQNPPPYDQYDPYDPQNPQLELSPTWYCRPDAFSSFRSSFEIRTYRLCRRVLMFHRFAELDEGWCLVRSTDFTHRKTPIASYLVSATQTGYVKQVENYLAKSFPPLEFAYTEPKIDETVRFVDADNLENLPYGLDGKRYLWVDLDSEGLSGILTEQAGGWFYKRNLGNIEFKGNQNGSFPPEPPALNGKADRTVQFAPVELVATQPSTANLQGGQQQIMDLAGDGQKYLVEFSKPLPGYYRRDADGQWEDFMPFEFCPNINFNDPNLRMIDLNGDGHVDLLITEHEVFVWYPSQEKAGFGPAETVRKVWDEEKDPVLVFADSTQSIYLADMKGDGLIDIVRIRCGEVCYWPSLGYGRFGAKVTMDNPPWFDHPELFDQKRIRLGDIDGSGTTDIFYLGSDRVSIWMNQSGNSWSQPYYLTNFPKIDDLKLVTVVDLLGNGTACLVWSSPLPGDSRQPMRYIDLMGGQKDSEEPKARIRGQKPHLLVSIKNNLGAETRVHYAPSTRFYLEDRAAGTPWITKLPFPVHVVERVETYDQITGNRFVTLYRYHHGYYDGVEREFRGFGFVEQWDTESYPAFSEGGGTNALEEGLHVPPVYTKTWFHTGVFIDREHISNFFSEREYYREPQYRIPPTATEDQKRDIEERFHATLLPDTVLPGGLKLRDGAVLTQSLNAREEYEACRALKGRILRQEIYAVDDSVKSEHPYSVSERNYEICWLQPSQDKQYAVFHVYDRETIDYHYERNPDDPRVTHAMTLEVDSFGNVLKQVAIAYPRRSPQFPEQGQIQGQPNKGKPLITYTENQVTNEPDKAAWYRIGVPIETRTYEITGIEVTGLPSFVPYRLNLIHNKLKKIKSRLEETNPIPKPEIAYEEAPDGSLQRRLIERVRTRYRKDSEANTTDPTPLPLGEIDSLALPCESFKLAFTPGLLTQVYSSKIAAGELNTLPSNDGKYPQQADVDGWWIPSGRQQFDPTLFYLVTATEDPFGHKYTVTYDDYKLLTIQTQDPLENIVQVRNDYRVIQPWEMTDPNLNRSQVAFDALGMVVGSAVMGKATGIEEGDKLDGFIADLTDDQIKAFFEAVDPRSLAIQHLGTATTRIIYDFNRIPVCAAAIARKQHVSDLQGQPLPLDRVQVSFVYSDGFGREVQTKIQAEPGLAPVRDADGVLRCQQNLVETNPRWVGTGRTIYNNKGKPVKQYEPFFSPTHTYETEQGLVECGVTPILFYDPVERVVATLHPNHTYEKVVFDPWQQMTWDVNDIVLTVDPKADQDVGSYFERLPERNYLPTWYDLRTDPIKAIQEWPDVDRQGAHPENAKIRAAEKAAAEKAVKHVGTPTIAHFDTLGRPFLALAHNRFERNGIITEETYSTRVALDIEGNQREVIDARGNRVMRYDYDLLGHVIHSHSMDAGGVIKSDSQTVEDYRR